MNRLRVGEIRPFAFSFLAVAGVTVLLSYYEHYSQRSIAAALFILLIVMFAERYGTVSAAFTATLVSVSWTYNFLPAENVVNFDTETVLPVIVYFVSAFWTAAIMSRVRRQKNEAERRERETETLYRITMGVLAHPLLEESLGFLVGIAGGGEVCTFVRVDPDGGLSVVAGDIALVPERIVRILSALEHDETVEVTEGGTVESYVPLRIADVSLGVMVARIQGETKEADPLLLTVASHGALALQRSRLEHAAGEALGKFEAERLKSSLLASVSHDLRTPLASIKATATGFSLGDVMDDEKTRAAALASIVGNADRLDRLVGNLLNMSRLEAGAWKPVKELFPFSEIVAGVLGRFSDAEASRILVDLPADLPLVPIDGQQMEQVLWNLVENAFKYVPGDSPLVLRVRAHNGFVEVLLRDHGKGIPKGEERLIFQKFYRAHRGGERGAPGVGMGLAICREIVEAHGGQIHASNAPGGGALFTIKIPLEEEGAEASCKLLASPSSS